MTTYVSDTFTRTSASSWGTADTGGAWTTESLANVTYSTDGSTASRAATSQANTLVKVGSTGAGNKTVQFRVKVSNLCADNYRDLEFELRRWDGDDDLPYSYGMLLRTGRDSMTSTIHARLNNGASRGGITGGAYDTEIPCAANEWMWCKGQIEGKGPTTIRMKMWLDGSSEPGWQVEVQDNQPSAQLSEISTGPHFMATMLDNLGTPDYTTFTIDDLTVVSLDSTPTPISVYFVGSDL